MNSLEKWANLNSIPISFRPKWINNRSEFDHYEINLIVGEKNSGYILTLVERLTRKAFAIKLENRTMKHTNEKFLKLINKENIMLKSIAKDNGMEFNLLHEITNKINVKLYTFNTYASCERGTNENFNGLMRREYPKSTNFSNLNDDKINSLLSKINKMPWITA
ncbi:transposase [Mesoplasma tabanidae]|uniref:Transposase n=1 Tax=Mesoplasma tabanidae TaxID=219745 RepID=A0A2K8P3A7_9MOLU|nr:IS30 family transposase [Mesoplasma tabanidae]ATZ21229.1 transposase [Mesoplasma tabanidae]